MKTLKTGKYIWLLILIPVIFLSCEKEDKINTDGFESQSGIVVKLTQNSTPSYFKSTAGREQFDQVNIDIESVSIHYGDSSSNGQWIELATNAGIYDLTDLSDLGLVLADSNGLPPGHVGQMRLLLGDSNTVMVDSVLYDLKTPSGQQSGLKINLDFTIQAGYQYEILLEFDPEESVVHQGNGRYLLKPVIHAVTVIENQPELPWETMTFKPPSDS